MASYLMLSLFLVAFSSFCSFCSATEVTFDNVAIKINGERKIIISGSIHYPRSTPEMWPSLVKKAKKGGLNAIETYVFWNAHEPQQRQYDFSGHLDLVRFIKTIHNEGLYAILRVGPYVCAEWSYGGLPVWLHSLPNMTMRTNNDAFKTESLIFVTKIVDMMKSEKLFAAQGGPIILAQIENEYGDVEKSYGDEGWKYIQWWAQKAEDFKVEIPWIMCKQNNAPWPMLPACNGFYCDSWHPPTNSTPKIWTENWTGWFKAWGDKNPRRTAEDVAFAVARFYQISGTLQNYYMYHGGTNFGNTGGPYITTSYDYDAPLDEYGNYNQPKWGHLKQLHEVLFSIENNLVYGERTSTGQGEQFVTVYAYEGKRACFFSNSDASNAFTFNHEGVSLTVPPWSVSILPDCVNEAYNTAKVNVQTSIMMKQSNEADDGLEPYNLEWLYRTDKPYHIDHKKQTLKGSILTAPQLIDQKRITNDTNDYLWIVTRLDLDKNHPVWGKVKDAILHVETKGQVLHAFVNGKHFGSRWCDDGKCSGFTMEVPIKLKNGKRNDISLLSVTVGLQNYGPFLDTKEMGIHGPVKIMASTETGESAVLDISTNNWVYKSGMNGEDKELYLPVSHHKHNWHFDKRPSNRMLTWYKTNFKTPMGEDPVVVDLYGLDKGVAWVNGINIGRYWPKFLAPEDGCDVSCDYRGSYYSKKCNTNCGKPTQRWYHIPRSLLSDEGNVLVVFEELGGTPELVSIQTVTVGTVCANAYEGNTLELSCQGGRVFSKIKFASFGLPRGTCGNFFRDNECYSDDALSVVKNACLGRERCSLEVSEKTFGSLRCKAESYTLAVEAIC